jgi:protein-S-isoprenylcysteine O-methyltransferase Ste14
MEAQKFARIAAALFSLVALLHVLRLALAVPAVFGSWSVPVWLSGVGLLVAGVLAWLGWTAS